MNEYSLLQAAIATLEPQEIAFIKDGLSKLPANFRLADNEGLKLRIGPDHADGWDDLKKLAEGLASRSIRINQGDRFLGMWVATALTVDEDELMVEVNFSPELAPELLKMKQILML